MTRFVLIQPVDYGSKTSSTGLSFISEYLKSEGHNIAIIDANFHSSLARMASLCRPDIIGINTMRDHVQEVVDLVADLRERSPDAKIVLGGHESTRDAKGALQATGADYAIQGDGIPGILQVAEGRLDAEGLAYFSKGKFVNNGVSRYKVERWKMDLDAIGASENGRYTVSTSIGCRYQCTFCNLHDTVPEPLERPIEKVIEDMALLRSERDARLFYLADDNFMSRKGKLSGYDSAMKDAGILVPTHFMARPDSILKFADEVAQCRDRLSEGIHLGSESFLDSPLKRWKKGFGSSVNFDVIEYLRDQKVMPELYMLIGDLETDVGELKQSLEVFRRKPGLLALPVTMQLHRYWDQQDNQYPDFMKLFERFFQNIVQANYLGIHKNTRAGFMAKETVSQAKGKEINDSIDVLERNIELVAEGKRSLEEALENALLTSHLVQGVRTLFN